MEFKNYMKCVAVSFAALGLFSCSSGELPDESDVPGLQEIRLSSAVLASTVTQTRAEGVIASTLTAPLSVTFVRLDQSADAGVYPNDYTDVSTLPASIQTNNTVTFTPSQFYEPSGKKTKLMAWCPNTALWSKANGTATFDAIDGSADILMAQPVEGSRTAPFNATDKKITFSHVLTQVRVYVKAESADFISNWGEITDIEFAGKSQSVVLTLPSPQTAVAITPSFPTNGATDLKMRAKDGMAAHANLTLSADETEVGYAMFAPHAEGATGASLSILIKTVAGGEHTIPLTYDQANLLAGKTYALKLVFKATTIVPTATITPWEPGTQPDDIPVGGV